jgi:hypothetical protein
VCGAIPEAARSREFSALSGDAQTGGCQPLARCGRHMRPQRPIYDFQAMKLAGVGVVFS